MCCCGVLWFLFGYFGFVLSVKKFLMLCGGGFGGGGFCVMGFVKWFELFVIV